MSTEQEREQELTNNYNVFRELLPDLSRTHAGKFALMRQGELVQIFDSPADALKFAEAQYSDDLFSIQQITDRVVELGYFSHAVSFGPV